MKKKRKIYGVTARWICRGMGGFPASSGEAGRKGIGRFADTPQGLAGRQAAHRDTHRREHTARRSRREMPPPQAWGRGTAILRQL